MRKNWTILLLLAVLAHAGCGYSLAGRGSFLPEYIKRIGVPLFVWFFQERMLFFPRPPAPRRVRRSRR